MMDRSSPPDAVLVGIDGGGTHTRVLCTDLAGKILARTQAGGANPSKNRDAEQNIQSAIALALTRAGRSTKQVAALIAGIAGLDEPADQQWAVRFCSLPGLLVQPICVNDAVIAWAGALTLQPGIIVIAGTGCVIFGVNEAGRQFRNYDFRHYASATARDLTFATVFRLLAGEGDIAEQRLITDIFQHFGVESLRELAEAAVQNDMADRRSVMRLYGEAAPLITRAATQGSPLASEVCNQAAAELALGVRLLSSLFVGPAIPYALIGSVAQSDAIRSRLQSRLARSTNHNFQIQAARLPPEAGAILLAHQQLGKLLDPTMIANLLANG